MRRSYKLEDLGCAYCASKMEEDIKKLEGVQSIKINFLTQKLTLEANEELFDALLEKAQNICTKYESDCVILR